MRQGACSKYGATRDSFSKTLFVSDLDGTLLSSEKRLLNGQTTTLNHLIDHGLQFTVATARSIQAINALLKDVHLSLPAITLGGSLVTWPTSGEHLVARVLSRPTATGLLTRFLDRGIFPFVASMDGHRDWAFHSYTTSAAAGWYVDEKRAYGDPRLCWYDHPSEVLGTNILSMTTFVEQQALSDLTEDMLQVEGARNLAGNPDSPQAGVFLTSIIDEIVGVATDYVDYHAISDWNTSALRSAKPGQWLSGQTSRVNSMPVRQFPGWYEVTVSHLKADKGSALGSLCQALNSKWDRVVVFGDDVNDLPLFERADYAIAVANAAPEVLTKANQVIQSNDSGSVIGYLAQHSTPRPEF